MHKHIFLGTIYEGTGIEADRQQEDSNTHRHREGNG